MSDISRVIPALSSLAHRLADMTHGQVMDEYIDLEGTYSARIEAGDRIYKLNLVVVSASSPEGQVTLRQIIQTLEEGQHPSLFQCLNREEETE